MTQPIGDEVAELAMANGEQVLDFLVDSYRKFREKDAAEGASDEYGALGGVQMLAASAPYKDILLALAVGRLAGSEGPK